MVGELTTRGLSTGRGIVGPFTEWTPIQLGNKLLAWWDASNGVTLSGNQITSWADRKNGIIVSQPVSSARPAWGEGAFPSLVFDGNDDCLELATNPFPAAGQASEIWNTCQQDATDADTTVRYSSSYGGLNAASRRLGKTRISGISRAEATIGDGSTGQQVRELTIPFNSRHVLRMAVGTASTSLVLDGVSASPLAVAPNTGTGRFTIGCAPAANTNFWLGRIRDVIVTLPLSNDEAAQLQSFLMPRRAL